MRTSTKWLALGVLSLSASIGYGQSLITAYSFERVGEFHMANPAAYQPYRAVVGLPGLGMQSTYIHNSAYDIAPLLASTSTGNEAVEMLMSELQPGDRLLIDQTMDLAYIGFRTGKGFWSLGVQLRNQVNFEYPVDIMKLAWYGSVPLNGQVNMTNNQTAFNSYISYHLGYQHELMDGKLRIGGRFKYLSGLGNFSSTRTDLHGDLNSDVWAFQTDIESRASLIVNPNDVQLGNITSILFSDNRGYGFDIGVSYEVLPGLEISAAALDVGSITWTTNTAIYRSKGSFEFDGVHYNYPEGGNTSPDSIVQEIVDALEFTETTGESYTQALPSSYMFGARYQITPKHGFSAVYQMNQWGTRTYNNVGVSYIGTWSKWFSFYANYALIDGNNSNVGAGFSLNLGPVQLFMVSDDVMALETMDMLNLRFGLNVALYRKDLRGYEPKEVTAVPTLLDQPVETEEATETPENASEETPAESNEAAEESTEEGSGSEGSGGLNL